jgi:hypothetical protein
MPIVSVRFNNSDIVRLDKITKNKSDFIRKCVLNSINEKEDLLLNLKKDAIELESKLQAIKDTIQNEELSRNALIQKNKDKINKLYINIYKGFKDSYLQDHSFIFTSELNEMVNDYCALSFLNRKEMLENLKRDILNEVNDGTRIS